MLGFLMDKMRRSRSRKMVRFDHEGDLGFQEAFLWMSVKNWHALGEPSVIEVEVRAYEPEQEAKRARRGSEADG